MKSLFPALAALVLFGTATLADEPPEEGVEEGRAMAQKLCARCHAIGLKGDSPFEDAPPFRTMGKQWPIDSLAEAFAEGIVVGHPSMPPFQFEPDQIGALLNYMSSLQTE